MEETEQTIHYSSSSDASPEEAPQTAPVIDFPSQKESPAQPCQIFRLAPMRFSELLCNYRREASISQLKASEISGVDTQLISQLENGDFSRLLHYSNVKRIEIVRSLCNAYKGPEGKVLETFQKEFSAYCDSMGLIESDSADSSEDNDGDDDSPSPFRRSGNPLGNDDLENISSEPLQLTAIFLKAAIILLVLLIVAGWFYTRWLNKDPGLTPEETDFSSLVPQETLPMETLPLP